MNALITALEERGLRVEVTPLLSYEEQHQGGNHQPPSNATRVMVSGEWVHFGLSERRSVEHGTRPDPPKDLQGADFDTWIRRNEPHSELVPKGVLELRIKNSPHGARSTWRDGKRRRLEGQLSDFVAYLPAISEALKKQQGAMLERQREYSEMEALRLQEEQRKQEETRRIERLERELGRWRLARDIRDYVAEVRRIIAAAGGGMADDEELVESLTWAEATLAVVTPL
jgi:hypothetical protein